MADVTLLTGRQLAISFGDRFAGHDWIAELAHLSRSSRDFVELHLREDRIPTTEILRAADAIQKNDQAHSGTRGVAKGQCGP
ncbi:hypothetical protein AB6806_21250 [Bosea sp. RCC_152_1]|uniref:hypothetical protein n=1 Tax=Bosea sp. RCC_152_1 TaxID=3239228 RepID=UPI00352484C4